MTAKHHCDEDELLADQRKLERIYSLRNEKSAGDAKILRGATNSVTPAKQPVARCMTVAYQRKATLIPNSKQKQGATPSPGKESGNYKMLPVWKARTICERLSRKR